MGASKHLMDGMDVPEGLVSAVDRPAGVRPLVVAPKAKHSGARPVTDDTPTHRSQKSEDLFELRSRIAAVVAAITATGCRGSATPLRGERRMKRIALPRLAILALVLVAWGIGGSTATASATQPSVVKHGQTATGSVHPPGWGAPLPGHPKGLVQARTSAVQTATMYDSISLSALPANPFAQAGYTSGYWPTYLPMRQAWPKAHTISVAISASHHADCLDVEPGDASPSEVPGWIAAVRADPGMPAGVRARPCIYSSLYPWETQIDPILAAHHIALSSIFRWDADFTYTDHLDAGFDATQWTDKCLGRNLDCSRVTLSFLSIAQPPYVLAPAKPPGPSPATLAKWRELRGQNFTTYHAHGCKNGLVHDKAHTRDDCFKYALGVVTYQEKLWTTSPRWHVFGPHGRTKTLIAWIIRPTASIWSHELSSTRAAYQLHGCDGPVGVYNPDESSLCNKLRQRESYYTSHLKAAYGLNPFVY
jgi:hypothetical protein